MDSEEIDIDEINKKENESNDESICLDKITNTLKRKESEIQENLSNLEEIENKRICLDETINIKKVICDQDMELSFKNENNSNKVARLYQDTCEKESVDIDKQKNKNEQNASLEIKLEDVEQDEEIINEEINAENDEFHGENNTKQNKEINIENNEKNEEIGVKNTEFNAEIKMDNIGQNQEINTEINEEINAENTEQNEMNVESIELNEDINSENTELNEEINIENTGKKYEINAEINTDNTEQNYEINTENTEQSEENNTEDTAKNEKNPENAKLDKKINSENTKQNGEMYKKNTEQIKENTSEQNWDINTQNINIKEEPSSKCDELFTEDINIKEEPSSKFDELFAEDNEDFDDFIIVEEPMDLNDNIKEEPDLDGLANPNLNSSDNLEQLNTSDEFKKDIMNMKDLDFAFSECTENDSIVPLSPAIIEKEKKLLEKLQTKPKLGERPVFKCDKCNIYSNSRPLFARHLKTTHSDAGLNQWLRNNGKTILFVGYSGDSMNFLDIKNFNYEYNIEFMVPNIDKECKRIKRIQPDLVIILEEFHFENAELVEVFKSINKRFRCILAPDICKVILLNKNGKLEKVLNNIESVNGNIARITHRLIEYGKKSPLSYITYYKFLIEAVLDMGLL